MLTTWHRARLQLHSSLRSSSSIRNQMSLAGSYSSVAAGTGSTSSSSPSASPSPPGHTIALTPTESSLFDFLLYIQHLYAPNTELRVAGGWVRDKLRGAESEDIDIVLDNIYGKDFANHITAFQKQRKLPLSSVGVVKANSEKSKHLEVAQVRVEGLMVDFVHLRSEEYTEESRIPEASFAAPAEDALRRDTTINALFYNLHTQQVEDFTGRGLDDLRDQLIRTPLEPLQTFLDDPLRVLRAIRFACQFGFQLDDAISETVLTDDQVREAMKRKVSRERVGIEVKKMLSGSNPARAFALLAQFKLLDIVFHHAGGESDHNEQDEIARSLRDLFAWTPEMEKRGEDHVRHLQQSRQAIHKHQISFIEATAALLAPFVLPSGHAEKLKAGLESFMAAASSGSDADWLQHVDEDMIIRAALPYIRQNDPKTTAFPRENLIELLKTNVKWPKPAAKRVTHILEAMLAFPTDINASDVAQNHIKLLLWSLKFQSALSPAIATLLTEVVATEDRERLVVALDTLSSRYTQQPKINQSQSQDNCEDAKPPPPLRRVDGKMIRDRLGGKVGPQIAVALEVLAVFEFVYPCATLDQELAFLDRLQPLLE